MLSVSMRPKEDPMITSVAMRALLAATLVAALPAVALAQAEGPTPEGREWHLLSYAVDGRLVPVPGSVDVTLPLEDGRVYGSSGCQGYAGEYAIAGGELTFSQIGPTSDVGCPNVAAEVEAAYLAALPDVAGWSIDSSTIPGDLDLSLFDADGETILQFVEPSVGSGFADIRELTALVERQQAQIEALRNRVRALERTVERLESGR